MTLALLCAESREGAGEEEGDGGEDTEGEGRAGEEGAREAGEDGEEEGSDRHQRRYVTTPVGPWCGTYQAPHQEILTSIVNFIDLGN